MPKGEARRGPAHGAVLCVMAAVGALVATGSASSAGATESESAPSASADVVAAAAERYRLRVDAVAYHLPGRTALGVPVGRGVVAVDPKLIPLGTRLYVPGYGRAIAADVGIAIKGKIIDLWMPNDAAARKWGRKSVTITVFR